MASTKTQSPDFALFGGEPASIRPIAVGQRNLPRWDAYEATFKALFNRQYYTNHGPLVQELESKLQGQLGVKHAVCVTNASIGLIMAVEALEVKGKVVVPAFTHISTIQALTWVGLTPIFCDVDIHNHHVTAEYIEPLIDSDVVAILAVNLWGDSCNPSEIEVLANKHKLKLIFDSAHGMGCGVNGTSLGSFGDMEVFSFNEANIVNASEGGCVTTNNDTLAAKLRNIRSSYGAGAPIEVVKTSNGRMSEAQAALALMSLDQLTEHVANNQKQWNLYQKHLAGINGISLRRPQHASKSNFQSMICLIDETQYGLSRNKLVQLLEKENIQVKATLSTPAHHSLPYNSAQEYEGKLTNSDYISQCIIQLPCGGGVKDEDILLIATLMADAHQHAASICTMMDGI